MAIQWWNFPIWLRLIIHPSFLIMANPYTPTYFFYTPIVCIISIWNAKCFASAVRLNQVGIHKVATRGLREDEAGRQVGSRRCQRPIPTRSRSPAALDGGSSLNKNNNSDICKTILSYAETRVIELNKITNWIGVLCCYLGSLNIIPTSWHVISVFW